MEFYVKYLDFKLNASMHKSYFGVPDTILASFDEKCSKFETPQLTF